MAEPLLTPEELEVWTAVANALRTKGATHREAIDGANIVLRKYRGRRAELPSPGGTIVAHRFTLERVAGSGGMGTVYRAVDGLRGGHVAIKLLDDDDGIGTERFLREAGILATLNVPGVVGYIDHGTTESGARYLAMEWLDGVDLGARLGQGPLTFGETVALIRQAAAALSHVHAHGVVHRDVKPSNMFLVGGDVHRLTLLDFGIAHLAGEARRLTRTGQVLGTAGYLAPEQVQGGGVAPRADVFALGCVFFECLAGRPPFAGANVMAVFAKLLLEDTPRLRDVRPDVPEVVDALVARMMAKTPEERPHDGAVLVEELARLGDVDALPSVAPAPTAARAPAPVALTLDEQRVVSVVLAGDPDACGAPRETGPSLTALEGALAPYGGRVHALGPRSMIVTMSGPGTAIDRAERAARCALALRARFAELPLSVVTGRGRVSECAIEGDVLDRGARALADATAHAVSVDDATAAMLDARFEIDHVGSTHVLRGEHSTRVRPARLLGKLTPIVGRARELAALDALFSSCVAEPAAGVALVIGPAGAGKSRICAELVSRVKARDDPVEILFGHGDSLGMSSPFGPIGAALCRAAGVGAHEPAEARRRKLALRVGRHCDATRAARLLPFLCEIARIPFGDAGDDPLRAARASPLLMSDAIQVAWEDWLTAECAAHPVLLVLEDLHWGDAATVRLVDATLRNLHDAPLMVLALARPEVHEHFPAIWSERGVQTIQLGPLARRASEALVRGALGADASAEVVARILDRGQGNPFYLEELVRAVAAGREETLPDSVLGTVEARLDMEGVHAKRVLRAASVFGDRFTRGGVEVLLGSALSPPQLGAILNGLVARELISIVSAPDSSAEVSYAFQHALVRAAAYEMLTAADRALGHRLAGEWLDHAGDADPAVQAEHFYRGGVPQRALPLYRRAAELALEASDLGAALERAARGIACGAEGRDLGALRLLEAEACVWRGDLTLAEERSVEAMTLLEHGSAAWFRAVAQAIASAGKLGHLERVEAWVQAASEAPAASGAQHAQLVCLCHGATLFLFSGRNAAADVIFARLERDVPDPTVLATPEAALLHQLFASRALYAGDLGTSVARFQAALAAFELAHDHRNAAMVRASVGSVYVELGDFEGAESTLRAAVAAAARMGLKDVESAALQNLGRVLAYRGLLEEARVVEQRAVDGFRRLGESRMEAGARLYLAEIALLTGNLDVAEHEARAVAHAPHTVPPVAAMALSLLGSVLLRRGHLASALTSAREAFALLTSLGAIEEGESRIRLVYAEALRAAGEHEEAASAIASAREHLLARAAKISDPSWRERFLSTVADNARTLALSEGAS